MFDKEVPNTHAEPLAAARLALQACQLLAGSSCASGSDQDACGHASELSQAEQPCQAAAAHLGCHVSRDGACVAQQSLQQAVQKGHDVLCAVDGMQVCPFHGEHITIASTKQVPMFLSTSGVLDLTDAILLRMLADATE